VKVLTGNNEGGLLNSWDERREERIGGNLLGTSLKKTTVIKE